MSEQFLSEIRIMAFGFAPEGWAQCKGQSFSIIQNTALFALIGNIYGGDIKQSFFKLPDLQGRAPMEVGDSHFIGETGGEQTHTLVMSEMPAHTHLVGATTEAADDGMPGRTPDNTKILAEAHAASGGPQPANLYLASASADQVFDASSIGETGGSLPHENMQPYLGLNFCIALFGIFPERP